MTTTEHRVGQRAPLTRERIIDAALRYIDSHGLGELSMHKLGAELGVKAMSLYKHVVNKDDLLDGVVEQLWSEVEDAALVDGDWRKGYESFAYSLREMVHRHPGAAFLITSHGIMPASSLRCIQAHITAATDSGVSEERAYAWLRTITSFALGTAFNDVAWSSSQQECQPNTVAELVRPDVPPELVAVAEIFCGQADPDAQFELGLDLMLRGIDS
ncbi:TetR/AcrR family transcriptional regulator [Haloechinothrix halophila]|uniref:TetR/AcrR family transcriptional regulator n=1 Tax=Haloechinothrix halophila TaxID=1069073 RepID=UPI0003F7C3CB|nr:TetR/AcrR family transcriptional regulator C-terminal domain-containing protein [Haloechinothrix halophila]